jgi:hypothetical protein
VERPWRGRGRRGEGEERKKIRLCGGCSGRDISIRRVEFHICTGPAIIYTANTSRSRCKHCRFTPNYFSSFCLSHSLACFPLALEKTLLCYCHGVRKRHRERSHLSSSLDPPSHLPTDSLKIGDYITVKNVKFQTFLCAEGILLEDVIVDQNLLAFEDALFCIHLQRQYSASNELETFLSTYLTGDKSNEDPNSLKYVQALQVPS